MTFCGMKEINYKLLNYVNIYSARTGRVRRRESVGEDVDPGDIIRFIDVS